MKTSFHIFFVVIYVTLNVKTLKKFMYFWVPSIYCPKLTSFISNTELIDLYKWHEKDYWYYASSKDILDLQVYFSSVSCLFSRPTSSLCTFILGESLVYFSILHSRFTTILVESIVYFSILNPCSVSLFYSSILSIFWAYILALRVHFSQLSCLFFKPTSSLCESLF